MINDMIDTITYSTPLEIDKTNAYSYTMHADGIPARTVYQDDIQNVYAAYTSGAALYMDRDTGEIWTEKELRAQWDDMPDGYRDEYDNDFSLWLACMDPYNIKRF